MKPENTNPQSNPNPKQQDDQPLVPSTQPLKNEPTPERADQEKQKQGAGKWEQKKSGAV